VDHDNKGFWDAIREHRLVFQKCKECGFIVHRPRPMCPQCLSTERDWVPSEGKGRIYSYVDFVYQNASYPGIQVPYVVVVVEMLEGVRMISNMIEESAEDICIGMPVEVVFDDIAEDLTLPKFRKIEE
jgi:hypothetical protein